MSVSRALASVLERRLEAFRHHLPTALDGDVKGVHQARVASRRLRELLPVLAPLDPSDTVRRARRAVRRVTRVLGPVRELDVSLGLIDEQASRHADEAASLALVRAWVAERREERRQALIDALTDRRVERLWRRVDALHEVVAHGEADESAWRTVLGERLAARALALADQMAVAGVLYASGPLHEVRIATKKLRYAVEVAHDLRLVDASSTLRVLKRQQDLLGRIHDLEVLAQLADQACAAADRPVKAARLVGEWHRECRELHGVYVRGQASVLRVVRGAATRLSRQVVGRRRPVRSSIPKRPRALAS